MKYEITGENLPILEISLKKGEKVICEGGTMTYRSMDIDMKTKFGGLGTALSRRFSGEKMAFNEYEALKDGQKIAFASSFPGAILPIEFSGKKALIVQKKAFLASTEGIERKIAFQKRFATGFFGGEGFIMQRISGNGTVFLEIDGSLIEKELKKGETLLVDTGHVVAYETSVTMNVETVKGAKNMLLGGEGFFNTKIVGPGKVYLQSMPISKITALYDIK